MIHQLCKQHRDTQTNQRALGITYGAASSIVTEILNAGELRHDVATAILAEITDSPAAAGDEQKHAVAERPRQLPVDALDRAARSAMEAAAHPDRSAAARSS